MEETKEKINLLKKTIENNINNLDKIDINTIDELMLVIKNHIEEYNNNLENWYDTKYKNDSNKFKEELNIFNKIVKTYESDSYLLFS